MDSLADDPTLSPSPSPLHRSEIDAGDKPSLRARTASSTLPESGRHNPLGRLAVALLWIGLACLLPACRRSPPPPPPVEAELPPPPPPQPPPPVTTPQAALRAVPPAAYPSFLDAADRESLRAALDQSRRWLRGRPADRLFVFGPRQVTATEMLQGLDLFAELLAGEPSPQELARGVAAGFDVFESVGDQSVEHSIDRRGNMLITGYFEPMIEASRDRRPGYGVPIYGRPRDLIDINLESFSERFKGERLAGRLEGRRLVPYQDRQQVRLGASIPAPVLAWAADRVDLFFLEVQGSGTLRYPDGREQRIGYAATNGRPYRSIGRLLIDEGLISKEKMSLQALRAYLSDHPEEVDRILDYNPSLVFFRHLQGAPVGNLGFPVTARRSLAVDQRLFPPAALAFLVTEVPGLAADGTTIGTAPLERFVLMQDTGGAIRGADRADFFWGRGAVAAQRAGAMKQPGRLYFILPKKPSNEPVVAVSATSEASSR